MNFTSMNNCPCNEPKRFQCIIRNIDNCDCDRYLLLTADQIRLVQYLLTEDVFDSDVYTLTVLEEEKTFEKI
jgi:hypothetical protein